MSDDLVIHRPPTKNKTPLLLCVQYVRTAMVGPGPSGILSGFPMSMVLAERKLPQGRQIYFVDLRGPWAWADGRFWPRRNWRYRFDTKALDSHNFGPLVRRHKIDSERLAYFRHWRTHYKTTWRQMLARDTQSAGELWQGRWDSLIDRVIGPRNFSAAVMFASETKLTLFNRTYSRISDYHVYCREAVFHPSTPNAISPTSLGSRKQALGFMYAEPALQTNLRQWTNRVFYIDHDLGPRAYYDGNSQPLDSNVVDPLSLYPGLPSVPFIGDVPLLDAFDASIRAQMKHRFLESIGVTNLGLPNETISEE
jgi:hypothetical protein